MEFSTPPTKILVILFDNLGDTVMATAVIKPLQFLFPGAKIGFWVKEYVADALRGLPLIRVHSADPFWDRSPGRAPGSFWAFARAVREVRAQHYDLAVILNAEWRRCLAAQLAGIAERVGFQKRRSQWFLTNSVARPNAGHTVEHHIHLLHSCFDYKPTPERDTPWLISTDASVSKNTSSPHVVLHPFSGDRLKTWPWDQWVSLIQRLKEHNPKIGITVLGDTNEKSLLGSLRDVQVIAGESLTRVKAEIARSTLFVGGDSGPAHMAAALGVPVVSLFSPTDPSRYAPKGTNSVIVIRKDYIEEIRVDEVMTILRRCI